MNLDRLHSLGLLVWAPVIGNTLLAVWAGVAALGGRRTLSPIFWATVLVVLAILAVQAVPGILLFIAGARPRRGLHLVYALLVLLCGVAQYGLRPAGALRRVIAPTPSAFREPRAMALLCLTQAALIARAWMTAALD